MTNIKKRLVSMILALCMVFTMMPITPVQAADPRYYTVEKYDSEGNGTMLVNPTVSTDWTGTYGDAFVTSLLGSDVKVEDGVITGIRDDSQEDGWLDNGDMGEGSKWVVAVWAYSSYSGYSSKVYTDASYFYASSARVVRFMFVPGNDLGKAGITANAGYSTIGSITVSKDDLIMETSAYDPAKLGGNRLNAYNKAIEMILNTTDATAESVAEALSNLQNAKDSATDVSIPEESLELYQGQVQTLTPDLEPAGSTDELTWTSSDETVATVEDGVVKGMGAGTATITVTAEDPAVTDSVEVTVNDLQALYITNMGSSDTIMAEKEELMLIAFTEPNSLPNLDWQWSVEDESIAEVTPMEGNEYMVSVTGKSEGKTNVTVSLGSKTSSFEVTVTPYEGPYVYFEYADGREPQLLDENDTITLTCLDEGKFVVGNAPGTTVWSGGSDYVSSLQGGDDLAYWVFVNKETGVWNPWDIRTLDMNVDSGGWTQSFKVNCVSSGITELKNYVGDQEVTMDSPYSVEGTVSGIAVTTKGLNSEGEWINIPVQALNYDTSDTTYNFRWQGNTLVMKMEGQATMSVFMKDNWNVKSQFIAHCGYVALESFSIWTPETFTITGERDFMTGYYMGLQLYTGNLQISYTPSTATNKELIWESLTPDIAFFMVEHNSGIVPRKCGTAKFKVTSKDNPELTQEVTVKFLYMYPLESAELAKTEYSMEVGDTETLDITTTPSNATEKGFSYSYDKDGIVEIKDGKIVAKSAGEVTVTGTPLDDTMGCNNIEFTVTVTGSAVEQDDPTEIVADGIAHGLKYLENQSVNKYGDEWTIFTILRAGGSISDENKAAYLDSVEEKLAVDAEENKLQPTDYVRIVLTLGVMGENPESFRNYNLIEKLYTWKDLDWMTSNQISWTLLALDSKNYDVPADAVNNREQLIEWLLLFQDEDGAFMLTDMADVDMTGMIMQALAPYNNEDHPEVQAAFTKALAWLQGQMTTEAGFAENAQYNENSCTTAQVLTALAVAGIDPLDPENGFTVGKKNMVTNLYSYMADDGFYWDPAQETKGNAMGTQQVTYALEAYRRFAANENSLYDLSDVTGKELKIVSQPEDFEGEVGETAAFTVEAEGEGLTYQWQYCNANSGKWGNSSMNGSNTNEICVPITNYRNGQKYRCVITDAAGNTVTSDEAVMTVKAPEKTLKITGQPEDFFGSTGDYAVFTVEAEGEGLTYQWQYSNANSTGWANSSMTGADTASLTVKVTNARIGQKYRCVVKDAAGNTVTSDVAVIRESVLVITAQPEDFEGKVGEKAAFTVEAEGNGLTYQWQYSNAGSDRWANSSMEGNETDTITVPVINYRNGQKYRCVVTNAEGKTVISETAVLHVAE